MTSVYNLGFYFGSTATQFYILIKVLLKIKLISWNWWNTLFLYFN